MTDDTTPPEAAQQPLLIGVAAAAQALGIGRNSTYELVRSGALPSILVGRRVLVPRAALQRWVDAAANAGATDA